MGFLEGREMSPEGGATYGGHFSGAETWAGTPPEHPGLFRYMDVTSWLAASCGQGTMWGRGELGAGGLTLSGRCGWRGIRLTTILETSDICSLGELRRQVVEPEGVVPMVKPQELVQVLVLSGEPSVGWPCPRQEEQVVSGDY